MIHKSADPCRCCWHCRYYIRPLSISMRDGPATQVCKVDRYPVSTCKSDQWHQGDKDVLPDDYCDKFLLDPSLKLDP